jgi:hypothetical protein
MAIPGFTSAGSRKATRRRHGVAFAELAPGDLDIAVLGELSAPELPFHSLLEPGALKVKGFEAALRCG